MTFTRFYQGILALSMMTHGPDLTSAHRGHVVRFVQENKRHASD